MVETEVLPPKSIDVVVAIMEPLSPYEYVVVVDRAGVPLRTFSMPTKLSLCFIRFLFCEKQPKLKNKKGSSSFFLICILKIFREFI